MSGKRATVAKTPPVKEAKTEREQETPLTISAGLLRLQALLGNRGLLELLRGQGAGLPANGAPLDAEIRAEMESRFGESFADVRIHQGQAADLLGARAFTTGRDIAFAQGEFAPETSEGQRLLAHELAHVVQQRRTDGPVATNHNAESDAHEAAGEVIRGGAPQVRERAQSGAVQHQSKNDPLPFDLPPELAEYLKKAPKGDGPITLGNVDPELAAKALELLKSGKRQQRSPPDFLNLQLLPSAAGAPLPLPQLPLLGGFPLWVPTEPNAVTVPVKKEQAAKPVPKKPPEQTSPAPVPSDLVSVEGVSVTEGQLEGLARDTLLHEMSHTLDWLRANKVSSKKADEVGRYYAALSNVYREQKSELELQRRFYGPSRPAQRQAADLEAGIAIKEDLAQRFPGVSQSWEVPVQILKAEDRAAVPEVRDVGVAFADGGAIARSGRQLDSFSSLSVDPWTHDYVAWFPDGTQVAIPRYLIDANDADGSYGINTEGGVREFRPRESTESPVLLPPKLDKRSLPRLFGAIEKNRDTFDTAELLNLAGRNVLTHESLGESGATVDKVIMGLMILKAGASAGSVAYGYANRGRSFGPGGRGGPGTSGPPANETARIPYPLVDLNRLGGSRFSQPANDLFVFPEPALRTGTGDIFLPRPQPTLRLLPNPSELTPPSFVPFNDPVLASAGGGGKGGGVLGGGAGWGWSTGSLSASRVSTGGGWREQSQRGEAIKAKSQALEEQVASEIDRINNRRSSISDQDWKDERAGLTKRLYNLREQQHALQILEREPNAVVLTQVRVLGVNKGGTFTATEDIAGSGRIPDVGVIKPEGRLTLVDSKTQNEVINSIRKRGSGLVPSSPIGKQVAKEDALKKFGGDWILQGEDPLTGERFTFTMDPASVDRSRPVPYGQYEQ